MNVKVLFFLYIELCHGKVVSIYSYFGVAWFDYWLRSAIVTIFQSLHVQMY